MDQQTAVIGWFGLALIIAGIAQGKNHSGFLWFLLGILFGPAALFMLILLKKLKSEE